jgi:hypothetical protein
MYDGTLHHLFIDFEKVYDTVSREMLYNIPTVFYILMKLV